MNKERIYDCSREREFLKELYLRRREDEVEGGIQAVGLITKNNSLYKINENDGLEPHTYSFAGLCSFINSGTYKIFARGKMIPILQETKRVHEQGGLEVRITSSPTTTVFAISSMSDISVFQIQSIYVLVLNALSLGFENIKLGISSKNFNIEFGMDILEAIDCLEKKLDDVNDFSQTSFHK